MKTTITTTVMIFFITSIAFCQSFKITGGMDLMYIKYAMNSEIDILPTDIPTDAVKWTSIKQEAALHSRFETDEVSYKETSNETGFYIGIALSDITLFNKFELQPEIRFVGIKDFNQIQIPVFLKYRITDKFNVYAGPNFAFLLDPAEYIESFNFALDLGVSYSISRKISVDARYDWGQTNLLKDGGNSNNYIKINNIQFGLAYHFGNK